MEKFRPKRVTCLRCGHSWVPRGERVSQCPARNCHSPLWDVPRTPEEEAALKVKREATRKDP
jgi:hypothetical protein